MTTTLKRPKPSHLSKAAVGQLAQSVAQQIGFSPPGADIMAALSALGGRLSYKEFGGLGESDSGSLVVHAPERFDIYIATNTSQARDQFTIAHEIGHYVLHFLWPHHRGNPVGPMEATRYGSDRAEWEANWFAAAFLMPEEAFSSSFAKHACNMIRVAEEFGVSVMAAEIRAKALGLA